MMNVLIERAASITHGEGRPADGAEYRLLRVMSGGSVVVSMVVSMVGGMVAAITGGRRTPAGERRVS